MIDTFMNIKLCAPLVHCITNYVSAADCANALYAIGARALMSDSKDEAADVANIGDALTINIGTVNQVTFNSMLVAGKAYNNSNKPVVFDPAGVGVSKFRLNCAAQLLNQIKIDCICGNYSEILCLLGKEDKTNGVDANYADVICNDNLKQVVDNVKILSKKTNSIVAVTGKFDVIADKNKSYIIKNGCDEMSRIMGTGCIASSLCAAFLSCNKKEKLKAIACAISCLGIAGELALQSLDKFLYMSYKNKIIDILSALDKTSFKNGVKYEI